MTGKHDSDASQFNLLDAIQNGRSIAQEIDHGDSRSRRRLYQVLAHAYRVVEEAGKNPDTYNLILGASGLRVQARAPFTPALKLIFGRSYDKTRLTEYAAALRLARERGLRPSEVAAFIESQPGGIKGCVRTVRKKNSKDKKPARLDIELEALPVLGFVSWLGPAPPTGKFMTLLARQPDEGRNPEIIDVLDQDEEDVAGLMQRTGEKLK